MEEKQQQVTPREILERGISIFRRILNQPVSVNREDMCDLLNFEVAVNALISNMKATEGKTQEELMEIAKKAFSLAD
jgi:hypothetical protein